MSDWLPGRRAGVLLHLTSLPGEPGQGSLGDDAYRFVDFLAAGGFGVWQTLPLVPPDEVGSPYCARSADAGNPALIDGNALGAHPQLPEGMDFAAASVAPGDAWHSFRATAGPGQVAAFAGFMRRERRWLLPFALHTVLSRRFEQAPWWRWPDALRHALPASLRAELLRERDACRAIAFQQYLFTLQWNALREYAHRRGVRLFGDLPFYLDRNSAEVWWDRSLFRVDRDGHPERVAGVPPDYFSRDGQLWGNPLYDWERMAADGYAWWIVRLRRQLQRFDLLRIDHFRAFDSYWAVPADARTARDGEWLPGPADALLARLRDVLGAMPLVAEDLGIITDEVRALRDRFGLPGMLVLQFGFDGSADNPHAPENHVENAVVYTGTHDNDTTLGWYRSLDDATRGRVQDRLAQSGCDEPVMPDGMIEAAYASPSRLAVFPMQDLLGLGTQARMNTPGTVRGNWQWQFAWDDVSSELASLCRRRAEKTGRLPLT
jgi:4-alpha-glucanotransferase